MNYKWFYKTREEFDDICLTSDGEYLTGLWFENSKDALKHKKDGIEKELPIFVKTCKWLDIYFKGQNPNFIPEYRIENLTPFNKEVITIMNNIPFGKTITYNDIAKTITKKRKINKMLAQAVGGAVGKNPIPILKSLKLIDKPILFHVILTPFSSSYKTRCFESSINTEYNELQEY